jgi:uncharacterized protein YndB with AHSA1/START domain
MTDPIPPDAITVRFQRAFNAPAQAVFDAWTSAEMLKRWWPAGSDWETPVAEVDVRVGGRLRLVMRSPDGEQFGGRGEYVEITAPERLVFTWSWDGHEGHQGTQLIEVEFGERRDGTTTVVLTTADSRTRSPGALTEQAGRRRSTTSTAS